MTATADTDLAFAGPGTLAAMVRDGQVAPTELVELYLRRIDALDPRLNAFRTVRAESALAEAQDSDRTGPLAGVPIAVKDDLALSGEVATRGTRSLAAPGDRGCGGHPAVARRRRHPGRDHQRAGADDLPVDGERRQRRHPQSVGPRANARRLLGWLGVGGRRGHGGRRHRLRRRRLDPDSGGVLRPGRDEALPRPGVLAAGRQRVARPLDLRRPGPDGRRQRAAARRHARRAAGRHRPRARVLRQLRRGGRRRAPAAADRHLPQAAAGPDRPGLRRPARRLGTDRHPAERRRPRGRRTGSRLRPGPAPVPPDVAARRLRGVADGSPIARRSSAARARWRPAAATWCHRPAPPGAGQPPADDRPDHRAVGRVRRADDARRWRKTRDRAPRVDTAARRRWRSTSAGRFTPFTPLFNLTGQPAVSVPAGVGADGLPLAVQLVGRVGAEDTLYSLAAQIESAAPWAQRRPAIS